MRLITLVALFLLISCTAQSAQVEVQVDVPEQFPGSDFLLINQDAYLWSASGDVDSRWSSLDSTQVWGGQLVIGQSGTVAPSAGMELALETIVVGDATLRIASADGANGTGTGTTLTINTLGFEGGNIVIDDSQKTSGSNWQNKLVVHTLDTSGRMENSVRIGKDSLLQITKDGGTVFMGPDVFDNNASKLELAGGTLAVKDGLTLATSSIIGSGTVLDSVTLNSNDLYGSGDPTASILVNGGQRQEYGKDVIIGSEGGVINVRGSAAGAGAMEIQQTLRIDGANSKVSVGGGGGNEGVLKTAGIALSNQAKVDVLQYGRLELGITDSGQTSLIDNGSINIDGGTAAFLNAFDMGSQGRIDLSNNGIIDISTVTNGVELSGGALASGTGTNSIATGTGALSLAAPGILHATGELIVKANATDSGAPAGTLVSKAADSIVVSNGGTVRAGELRADFATPGALFGSTLPDGSAAIPSGNVHAELFSITAQTDVRGHDSVSLTATNAAINGIYRPGANDSVKEQAIVSGTLAGSLTVGTAGQAGSVLLDGGVLDGTGGQLNLANADASSRATLAVVGDSTVQGIVDASGSAGGAGFALSIGGNLTLADAASLTVESYSQSDGTVTGQGFRVKDSTGPAVVNGASAVFAGSGQFDGGLSFSNGAVLAGRDTSISSAPNRQLRIDADSAIDLSAGGISLSGFDSVTLDGALVAGAAHWLGLADETTLTMGTAARLEVGQSLATATHAGGDFRRNGAPQAGDWIVTGAVSPWSGFTNDTYVVSNIFGEYTFRYAPALTAGAGGGIWLDAYRSADIGNTTTVLEQLRSIWGTDRISRSFADAVSGIAQNMAANGAPNQVGAYALPGSASGNMNYAILAAIAANDSAFSHGGLHGSTDAGLLSAYTGSIAAGPLLASMETGNVILQQINNKLAKDRESVRLLEQEFCPDEAVASRVMKERLANRAWAGVLGVWQNADSRQGQAGYRYSAGGVLAGYDRAFGLATVGGSFGFVSGSYQDKSARAHDSTIDSYTLDLYASYALPANWYGTLALGYSLGDNNLSEFRGGNWDNADYATRTWHTGARIGYEWLANDALTISPALGLNYFHATANAHTWRYGGAGLLRYGRMTSDSAQMPVDIAVKYRSQFGPDSSLTFFGGLGYVYTFNDDSLDGAININGLAGVRPVQAIGRRSGHHAYSLNGGLALVYQNLDIGLRYDLYGKPDFASHQLTGTFGLTF